MSTKTKTYLDPNPSPKTIIYINGEKVDFTNCRNIDLS
jgi:hypothetical protein